MTLPAEAPPTDPMARTDALPDPSLLHAVARYERALMTDDVPVLDELFDRAGATIRSDAGAALVGHEAIARFRAGRGRPPLRSLERLHVRPIDADAAVVVAESRRAGGTGVQTQVWQRLDGRWRVTVAHVSVAPDPEPASLTAEEVATIWRTRDVHPADVAPPPPDRDGDGDGHRSALEGSRLAVKDLFAVAGQRIGGGNPAWLAAAPVQAVTASAVRRLLDAGCVLTGIAQTDELAFSLAGTNEHYGTPPNPSAPDRVPGGSTSGPASAVAAGLADVGLGTDTAGSVRVPASYCGLFGLRTTHGAVARDGVLPLAPSFDTVGVLTRTAPELAAVIDVLVPAAPHRSDVAALLLLPELLAGCEPSVRRAVAAAALALAVRTQTPLVERPGLLDAAQTERWFLAFRTVQQAEAWREHGAFVTASGALAPDVAARFRAGADVTERDEARARDVLTGAREVLHGLVGEDAALVLPSTAGPAPLRDADPTSSEHSRAATLRLTCLASLAGLPALSLPLARVGPLPLGLCLVGAPASDRALVRLAMKEELR